MSKIIGIDLGTTTSLVSYLKNGKPYNVGDLLKNPDLAKTMEKIVKDGEKAFYEGEVAEAIVKATVAAKGKMTLEDLKNYKIKISDPVKGTYRGYEIYTAAPPSSGGAHIIQILNILENYDMKNIPAGSARYYHLLSESMKMAFADRAKFMGDTDFIKIPLNGVINKEYAKTLKNKIDETKSQEYTEGDPWKYESNETTHYSIIDKEGNIVAVTFTVNGVFASGVVADGTGILLNNEMDDFDTGHDKANSIQEYKKPLSSMSPTIILKDGKPVASLGGLGAQKIITGITQVIIQMVDYDKDIQEAINFPRIHDAYGELTYEGRIDKNVIDFRGEINLVEFGALISRADVVVGNDSSPIHIASGFEKPFVIGIFGPGKRSLGFFPWKEKSNVIEDNEFYENNIVKIPVHQHEYRKDYYRGIPLIDTEIVYDEILRIIGV